MRGYIPTNPIRIPGKIFLDANPSNANVGK